MSLNITEVYYNQRNVIFNGYQLRKSEREHEVTIKNQPAVIAVKNLQRKLNMLNCNQWKTKAHKYQCECWKFHLST